MKLLDTILGRDLLAQENDAARDVAIVASLWCTRRREALARPDDTAAQAQARVLTDMLVEAVDGFDQARSARRGS